LKQLLIVSAVLSVLGIPGAYFMFRDRQIEVEYGTKTVCYKCKTVDKAPDKKIVWASKRHNYEVAVKESCCDKCKIEVESGFVMSCSKCGRELQQEVEKLKVDPRQAKSYKVAQEHEVCANCKPKPAVLWGMFTDTSRWGHKMFGPGCPFCRNQVQERATVCGRCGREFRWIAGTCSNCGGSGRVDCVVCKSKGKQYIACAYCSGRGGDMRPEGNASDSPRHWQTCSICKGSKGHSLECYSCKGSGKLRCSPCDGRGTIN